MHSGAVQGGGGGRVGGGHGARKGGIQEIKRSDGMGEEEEGGGRESGRSSRSA